SMGTLAFQASSALIRVVSAKVQSGSPGRLGMFTVAGAFRSWARVLTDTGLSLPTLRHNPAFDDSAAQIKASTAWDTYVKSRVCSPSPTMVKGFPASNWARNTPNTAP